MVFHSNSSKETNEELRQMVNHLARLCEISTTLNSTLEIDILLQNILETATEVLDCEAASLMLYDEQLGELLFAASTEIGPKKLTEIPVPLEGSIAGAVFRENRPLLINDVRNDPRHFTRVSKHVHFIPHSLVGVPLAVRDKVIGVLEALNKRKGLFSKKDLNLLSIIASQASVAISNAWLHQALQGAYDELSRLDKLKTDFMAIASHELRTPLGVILGYATFLKEEAQGEMSEHLDIVMNSALQLRSIVEDMTNMNLVQIGSMDLVRELIPIQEVIRSALNEITETARAKEQKVSVKMPKFPLKVKADKTKLTLAIVNVLSNAIRFSPNYGTINLLVTVKNHEVWVCVKDNGIGIPKSALKNIFDEFYQVEDHMTRRYGGMGLGLAISKGLVEAHEGRIWAESDGPGSGASVIIVLPWEEKKGQTGRLEPSKIFALK